MSINEEFYQFFYKAFNPKGNRDDLLVVLKF